MRGASVDPIVALKSGERGIVGNRDRFSAQRLMVITQIAMSMVLLVGALLFVRSYRNLMTLNPGMRESGITVGYFGYPKMGIKPENELEFKRQLLEVVQSVPGIQNAVATTNVPLSGGSWSHNVHVDGLAGESKFTYASPSYFATMGVSLLTGRDFTDDDTNHAPLVLIVNHAFVREYLGATQPIGHLVHVMPEPQYPERTYEIVGTVPDTKYSDLRGDTPPIAFVPVAQLPVEAQEPWTTMMIASNNGPDELRALWQTIEARYPGMTLQFFDFQQGIRDNLVGERMMAMLSGFLAFSPQCWLWSGCTEFCPTSSPSAAMRLASASHSARGVVR
jgi:hypothetical protein